MQKSILRHGLHSCATQMEPSPLSTVPIYGCTDPYDVIISATGINNQGMVVGTAECYSNPNGTKGIRLRIDLLEENDNMPTEWSTRESSGRTGQ